MSAFRPRDVAFAVTGFALMALISIAAAILSPPSAENLPSGSSFSRQADGSAAAYLTLERLGYAVRRSLDPIAGLAIDPPSTVLILADPADAFSNADRRALQSLIAAGATVLTTGCSGVTPIPGAGLAEPTGAQAPRAYHARFPSPLSAHAPSISMRAGCPGISAGDRDVVLYGDEHDPAVRFQRTGRGLSVWWAGSTPISNAAIDQPGHLELLLDLVGEPGRVILWDEFYHGQRRSLYSYAKRTPLPWAAAQVLLATLVAAAMYARRRAPILDRPVESRTSPLEFVDTMAGLYSRAGAAADAVAVARARLRRLLAAASGLTPDAADDRLVTAAAARRRLDADALNAALADSAGPLDTRMTADAALPLVRRLQACAAAVEGRDGTERATTRERSGGA